MQVLTLLPVLATLMLWPLTTGIIAKTFGRKFWIWFMLGFAFHLYRWLFSIPCLQEQAKNFRNKETYNHSFLENQILN